MPVPLMRGVALTYLWAGLSSALCLLPFPIVCSSSGAWGISSDMSLCPFHLGTSSS